MSREDLAQLFFEAFRRVYEGTPTFTNSTISWGHIAAELQPKIERFLAAERELMGCGHPRVCWVDEGDCLIRVDEGSPPLYGPSMRRPRKYCSACVEREKVREMCAKNLEGNAEHLEMLARTEDNQEVSPALIQEWKNNAHSLRLQAEAIRQLDLTKPKSDLAPSTDEGKGKGIVQQAQAEVLAACDKVIHAYCVQYGALDASNNVFRTCRELAKQISELQPATSDLEKLLQGERDGTEARLLCANGECPKRHLRIEWSEEDSVCLGCLRDALNHEAGLQEGKELLKEARREGREKALFGIHLAVSNRWPIQCREVVEFLEQELEKARAIEGKGGGHG